MFTLISAWFWYEVDCFKIDLVLVILNSPDSFHIAHLNKKYTDIHFIIDLKHAQLRDFAYYHFIWSKDKKKAYWTKFRLVLSTTAWWQSSCKNYSIHHNVCDAAYIVCFKINYKWALNYTFQWLLPLGHKSLVPKPRGHIWRLLMRLNHVPIENALYASYFLKWKHLIFPQKKVWLSFG
jgi:hypothetical protein